MNLNFKNTRVLVVGDVMLDSYWQGSTSRISPEAPVPIVNVTDQSNKLGGSGNVAMNITSLGAKCKLLSLVGDDSAGEDVQKMLEVAGIGNNCIIDTKISTTRKLRVLSQHQQLVRLDFEENKHNSNTSGLFGSYREFLPDTNIVVLSDYNKGALTNSLPFIEMAKEYSIPVLVDPKKKGFEEYAGAFLLTPNKKEFEEVVGICELESDLISKAANVIRDYNLEYLLITLGENGMTLVSKNNKAEHFPTMAREVYDVTGAGDTVVATLATGLGSGLSIQESVVLSCRAAGIVVGRVGASSVTTDDLTQELNAEVALKSLAKNKISDQKGIVNYINEQRSNGKTIVFTNGCFDILHAGHQHYLEKAASLGDILIVGVNSDASVSSLKGDSRPLNTLKDRMILLAGLSAVDMVVDFNEETPINLISAILPDILVKGGDYQAEDVVGKNVSGQVVIIDLVEGKSTTSILNKIAQ